MISELSFDAFPTLRRLLPDPNPHLALEAILAGDSPARVFVDQTQLPHAALIWARNHFYLAGEPANLAFNQDLRRLFAEVIYPQRQAAGAVMLEVFPLTRPEASETGDQVLFILDGKDPLPDRHAYYEFKSTSGQSTGVDLEWRSQIPAGMRLVPVDEALLAQKQLAHLDNLEAELVSERPSVRDFLARSFGVALVDGDTLAGWCLSEYNQPGRCEVGIETVEGYRQRGLGTWMGQALVKEARVRGITRVGWHCFTWNTASSATARKIGFTCLSNFRIYFAWYQASANLAIHGNISLGQKDYPQALEWFERSLVLPDAPAWANWGAGCACAQLGHIPAAFTHLHAAIDEGFTHTQLFNSSPHLDNLRSEPAWKKLLEKLP